MKAFRKYFKYDFDRKHYALKFYDDTNKLVYDTFIYHRDELKTHVEAFKSNLLKKNWVDIQTEKQAENPNSEKINKLLAKRMAILELK